MESGEISARIKKIENLNDPTLRVLELSVLLNTLFQERGYRIVVVGGSAIEILTEGKYASADLDICFELSRPPLRVVSEVMGEIGACGGVRSFQKGNLFIDILGSVETLAKTKFREIEGVLVAKPEDLLAERVLMAIYPQANENAKTCAEKLMAVALSGALPIDWEEAKRVASLPEYEVLDELLEMRKRVENKLR